MVGATNGTAVGSSVGCTVGFCVGADVGSPVGIAVDGASEHSVKSSFSRSILPFNERNETCSAGSTESVHMALPGMFP